MWRLCRSQESSDQRRTNDQSGKGGSMRPRLLIADADDAWLEVCERGLCDSGFTVATAQDGLACLAQLQRDPQPDVVVLELDMPWGGGDGVLAILREEACLLDHKVVIITGQAPPRCFVRTQRNPHLPLPAETLPCGRTAEPGWWRKHGLCWLMSVRSPLMLKHTQAVILAGGRGTRLGPLTRERAKPLCRSVGVSHRRFRTFELP